MLTVDGVGEWATASLGVGRGHDLQLIEQLRFPHSLGLLYSAFTYFTGLQGQQRRVQDHGAGPVRRAALRRRDPVAPARSRRRRIVPPEPEVLHLRDRAAHDRPGLRDPAPRGQARAGIRTHPARDGSRALGPGRDRGDPAADGPLRPRQDGVPPPDAGRRRGAQLRRQRPPAPRRSVRRHLDSAGRRRCGRSARRRPRRSGIATSTSQGARRSAAARGRLRRTARARRTRTACAAAISVLA